VTDATEEFDRGIINFRIGVSMQQTSIQIGFVLGVLTAPFLSGCIGGIGRPVDSESQTRNLRIQTSQATEPPADGQATIVHIDPQTGQIMVPPMAASTGQTQQSQINTLAMPPLRETVSPVPGGGVMIHLDERFLTPLMATIDGDGKLRIGHDLPTADSSGKK
jgi:hypothetical protein